jgi:hypothetical protein
MNFDDFAGYPCRGNRPLSCYAGDLPKSNVRILTDTTDHHSNFAWSCQSCKTQQRCPSIESAWTLRGLSGTIRDSPVETGQMVSGLSYAASRRSAMLYPPVRT